ncbi:helix-turn-helix domain-containing protein [Ruegeria atlantica]|uniref:helix-turn-helix domain-containing protein n=1 Tax=Ruegeria atlantica TaxID=81569 RepID=UPI00147C287B|nr:helix-turn-helix domain-containing protein [Ruegeria atlantica]
MSVSKTLGYSVRKLRRSKGLNQTQLAELAGVSLPTVSLIENGKTNATIDVLVAIAEALGTTLPHLMAHQLDTTVPDKQDLKAVLAKNVRVRREYLGLTRREVAERVGMVSYYIADIENRKQLLLLRNLIRIAEALEAQPTWLLSEGSDEKLSVEGGSTYPTTEQIVEQFEAERKRQRLTITNVSSLIGHDSAIWRNMVKSSNVSILVFLKTCNALSLDPEDLMDAC